MAEFNYDGAKQAGYSDQEIESYLSSQYPNFDFKAAQDSGYSVGEINSFLSKDGTQAEKQEERGALETAGRSALQYGLGLAQSSPIGFVYDTAVAPLASKDAQFVNYREELGSEIENLLLQKSTGAWTEEDQKFLENAQDQLRNPEKAMQNVQTMDIGLQSIVEKATGLDLKPEGVIENAARWTGYIKDPKKIFELGKTGLSASNLFKAIAPEGKEALRGLGAGYMLDRAEKGQFGPIGTIAAAVMGDVGVNLAMGAGKAVKRIIQNPKEVLAEVASKFTKSDKKELQKQIIQDFRDSNVQADLGTITDSDIMKWVQTRLAQSGLTGDALDTLKKDVTNQIKSEYKNLAESIGEAQFSTKHEAGEALKNTMNEIREAELAEARKMYQEANMELNNNVSANPEKLLKKARAIKEDIGPGQLKSADQKVVLDVIERLERDMVDSAGNMFYPRVKDLINNKLAIKDIVDYEVQGGTKQLLKGLLAEMDRTILSVAQEHPRFASKYIKAQKKFSEHAKSFRNKNVAQMLKKHDPAQLMNSMNTVQGIRDIARVLNKTPEGQKLFKDLSRYKLDELIGNNMVDSVTDQLKYGTFAKLLEKDKTREVIKELLPKEAYNKLSRLQRVSGKLSESAQKFYNASKSGATIEDVGVVAKVLNDMGNMLNGNPWPLMKTGAGIAGGRYLTKLMANPEFLRMVEELVMATESGNKPLMEELGASIATLVKAVLNEEDSR